MSERRSRRTRGEKPEVVPPKSDEEPDLDDDYVDEHGNKIALGAIRGRRRGKKTSSSNTIVPADNDKDSTSSASQQSPPLVPQQRQRPRAARKRKPPTKTTTTTKKRKGRPPQNAASAQSSVASSVSASGLEDETVESDRDDDEESNDDETAAANDENDTEDDAPKEPLVVKRKRGRPKKNKPQKAEKPVAVQHFRYKNVIKVECRHCGKMCFSQGIKLHERSCMPVYIPRDGDEVFNKKPKATRKKANEDLASESGSDSDSTTPIVEMVRKKLHKKKTDPAKPFVCRGCNKNFTARGINAHEKRCMEVYTERESAEPDVYIKEEEKDVDDESAAEPSDDESESEEEEETKPTSYECEFCGKEFHPQGFMKHWRACKKKQEKKQEDGEEKPLKKKKPKKKKVESENDASVFSGDEDEDASEDKTTQTNDDDDASKAETMQSNDDDENENGSTKNSKRDDEGIIDTKVPWQTRKRRKRAVERQGESKSTAENGDDGDENGSASTSSAEKSSTRRRSKRAKRKSRQTAESKPKEEEEEPPMDDKETVPTKLEKKKPTTFAPKKTKATSITSFFSPKPKTEPDPKDEDASKLVAETSVVETEEEKVDPTPLSQAPPGEEQEGEATFKNGETNEPKEEEEEQTIAQEQESTTEDAPTPEKLIGQSSETEENEREADPTKEETEQPCGEKDEHNKTTPAVSTRPTRKRKLTPKAAQQAAVDGAKTEAHLTKDENSVEEEDDDTEMVNTEEGTSYYDSGKDKKSKIHHHEEDSSELKEDAFESLEQTDPPSDPPSDGSSTTDQEARQRIEQAVKSAAAATLAALSMLSSKSKSKTSVEENLDDETETAALRQKASEQEAHGSPTSFASAKQEMEEMEDELQDEKQTDANPIDDTTATDTPDTNHEGDTTVNEVSVKESSKDGVQESSPMSKIAKDEVEEVSETETQVTSTEEPSTTAEVPEPHVEESNGAPPEMEKDDELKQGDDSKSEELSTEKNTPAQSDNRNGKIESSPSLTEEEKEVPDVVMDLEEDKTKLSQTEDPSTPSDQVATSTNKDVDALSIAIEDKNEDLEGDEDTDQNTIEPEVPNDEENQSSLAEDPATADSNDNDGAKVQKGGVDEDVKEAEMILNEPVAEKAELKSNESDSSQDQSQSDPMNKEEVAKKVNDDEDEQQGAKEIEDAEENKSVPVLDETEPSADVEEEEDREDSSAIVEKATGEDVGSDEEHTPKETKDKLEDISKNDTDPSGSEEVSNMDVPDGDSPQSPSVSNQNAESVAEPEKPIVDVVSDSKTVDAMDASSDKGCDNTKDDNLEDVNDPIPADTSPEPPATDDSAIEMTKEDTSESNLSAAGEDDGELVAKTYHKVAKNYDKATEELPKPMELEDAKGASTDDLTAADEERNETVTKGSTEAPSTNQETTVESNDEASVAESKPFEENEGKDCSNQANGSETSAMNSVITNSEPTTQKLAKKESSECRDEETQSADVDETPAGSSGQMEENDGVNMLSVTDSKEDYVSSEATETQSTSANLETADAIGALEKTVQSRSTTHGDEESEPKEAGGTTTATPISDDSPTSSRVETTVASVGMEPNVAKEKRESEERNGMEESAEESIPDKCTVPRVQSLDNTTCVEEVVVENKPEETTMDASNISSQPDQDSALMIVAGEPARGQIGGRDSLESTHNCVKAIVDDLITSIESKVDGSPADPVVMDVESAHESGSKRDIDDIIPMDVDAVVDCTENVSCKKEVSISNVEIENDIDLLGVQTNEMNTETPATVKADPIPERSNSAIDIECEAEMTVVSDSSDVSPPDEIKVPWVAMSKISQKSAPSKKDSFTGFDKGKFNRVKMMLYTAGSKVHRGRGFERIFGMYWDALCLRLSSPLSSNGSKRCDHAISLFLKSNKLRKLHNKFVMSIMRCAFKCRIPHTSISDHVPSNWQDRVKVPQVVTSTKPPLKKKNIVYEGLREQLLEITSVPHFDGHSPYKEVWDIPDVQINDKEQNPQEGPTEPVASSCIPGALVVDPFLRETVEASGMKVVDSAMWLLTVAVKEHIKNLLSDSIEYKKGLRKGEIYPQAIHYPNVLASTSNKNKKVSKGKGTGSSQDAARKKQINSVDLFAALTMLPSGQTSSIGGSISRMSLEHTFLAAFNSTQSFNAGSRFKDVQGFISNEITTMSKLKKPEEKKAKAANNKPTESHTDSGEEKKQIQEESAKSPSSSQMKVPDPISSPVPTIEYNSLPNNLTSPNGLQTPGSASNHQQEQGNVPATPQTATVNGSTSQVGKSASTSGPQGVDDPSTESSEVQIVSVNNPLEKPTAVLPPAQTLAQRSGAGRGAKNLAALMARATDVSKGSQQGTNTIATTVATTTVTAVPTPLASQPITAGVPQSVANTSITNTMPLQSQNGAANSTLSGDVESNASFPRQPNVPVRRGTGKGFGSKDLAAMRARSMTTNIPEGMLDPNPPGN